MSAFPVLTAESSIHSASTLRAMMRASVVLPEPGGPQKIMDRGNCLVVMKVWSGFPRAMRCFCPTTSVREVGRAVCARGGVMGVQRKEGLNGL